MYMNHTVCKRKIYCRGKIESHFCAQHKNSKLHNMQTADIVQLMYTRICKLRDIRYGRNKYL